MIEPEKNLEAQEVPAAQPKQPPLKVIVVSENSKDGIFICQSLRKMGHQTKYVESGIKAINAVSMHGCDLLVIDYVLPLLDGAETAELLVKLRRGGPKVEVIGLLNKPDEDDERRCIQAGMRTLLFKPLEEEDLKQAVGAIEMRRWQQVGA